MSEGYPKLTRARRVRCPLTKDWSNSSDRTVRYEPHRVAQDINVGRILRVNRKKILDCCSDTAFRVVFVMGYLSYEQEPSSRFAKEINFYFGFVKITAIVK